MELPDRLLKIKFPMIKDNKNRTFRKMKAFSFIEVMLSVFLLSVGIISVISIVVSGMNNTTESRRYLIASLLSQEGIEMVRNIRDNGAVETGNSFENISDGSKIVDPIGGTLADATSGNTALNYYDGYYRHTNFGDKTVFSRKVLIQSQGTDAKIVYGMAVWENGTFPSVPDVNNCNLSTQCAFTMITLNKWRQNQ